MWSLPRQQVQAIAAVSQDNMLYMLYKSFYLNTSWGQTLAYKFMSPFLHPETKQKINLTDKNHHPDLTAMYHPCQLEKRFGGEAETPTNFWPPTIGKHFVPDALKAEREKHAMKDAHYSEILKKNPLLQREPNLLQPGEFNRDFEAATELEQPVVVNVDDVQLRVNVDVAPRDSSNKK
jgi:hypothetical protein